MACLLILPVLDPGSPRPSTVPTGRYTRWDGQIVPFVNDIDQVDALATWRTAILNHPLTQAAGGCTSIGPTVTSYIDITRGVFTTTPTPGGHASPRRGPTGEERRC